MKNIYLISVLNLIFNYYSFSQTIIKVSDVKIDNEPFRESKYKDAIASKLNTKVLCYGDVSLKGMTPCTFHPFLNTLHRSFSSHKPLIISPDMIWLMICQGIAYHTNINSKEIRTRIVKHDSIKEIVLLEDNFKGNNPIMCKNIALKFTKLIKNDVDSTFYQLMTPTFSTTSLNQTTAYQICLLNATSTYFNYSLRTSCGIPYIKLEGTTADWQWILDNISRLDSINLNWWTCKLIPILTQFKNASINNIDNSFWKSIYKYNSESGGEYITGWISHLFPYLIEKQTIRKNLFEKEIKNHGLDGNIEDDLGICLEQFPSGISMVEFEIKDNSKSYTLVFYAGFVGTIQNKKNELKAEINWAIGKKSEMGQLRNSMIELQK